MIYDTYNIYFVAVKQASPYRRRGETTPKNITSSPLRKGVVSGVSHWNRSVSPTDFQAAVTYNVGMLDINFHHRYMICN